MSKPIITYQEKYRKGTRLDVSDFLALIKKNQDSVVGSVEIEIKDRTVYSDKSESMTVKINIE